jgi:hypothetical protein
VKQRLKQNVQPKSTAVAQSTASSITCSSSKVGLSCAIYVAMAMRMQRTSFEMLKFVYSMDHGRSITWFSFLPRMLVLMLLTCTQKYQFICTHDTDLYTKNINYVDKKNLHLRLRQGHNFHEGKI